MDYNEFIIWHIKVNSLRSRRGRSWKWLWYLIFHCNSLYHNSLQFCVLVWFSLAVLNTDRKPPGEERVSLAYTLSAHSQSPREARAVTKAEPGGWKRSRGHGGGLLTGCSSWLVQSAFLDLPGPLPRVAPPHSTTHQKNVPRHDHRTILLKQFFSWDALFPDT